MTWDYNKWEFHKSSISLISEAYMQETWSYSPCFFLALSQNSSGGSYVTYRRAQLRSNVIHVLPARPGKEILSDGALPNHLPGVNRSSMLNQKGKWDPGYQPLLGIITIWFIQQTGIFKTLSVVSWFPFLPLKPKLF